MLATATIHMALPATEALSSSCLPSFWTESYEAWPYLFIMVAMLAMHAVDFLIKASSRGRPQAGATCHLLCTAACCTVGQAVVDGSMHAARTCARCDSGSVCRPSLMQGLSRRRAAAAGHVHNAHSHGHSGCGGHVVGALIGTEPAPDRASPDSGSLESVEEGESADGDGGGLSWGGGAAGGGCNRGHHGFRVLRPAA